MRYKKLYVNLYANQLRDLFIEWKMPLLDGVTEYDVPCPYFKYEMPFILGIPIAISSIGYEIDVEILECVAVDLFDSRKQEVNHENIKIIEVFSGNKIIKINLKGLVIQELNYLIIKMKAKKFVNIDPIFFNFTYAIVNPFKEDIDLDVKIIAHFAYLIRTFQLYCYKFNAETGERIKQEKEIYSRKNGDMIAADLWCTSIHPKEEVDIYLSGSRLYKFIFMPRERFWYMIFIAAVLVAMSPFFNVIINIIKLILDILGYSSSALNISA